MGLASNTAMGPQFAVTHSMVGSSQTSAGAGRLRSLDALRGFDMFWIVGGQELLRSLARVFPSSFSNAVVTQFQHVRWQGLHFFDVIWPLFLFMTGVSLSFSLARRKASGATDSALLVQAGRRALILFVLGMIAQGNLLAFDLSKLYPCYSVLHGIAAGYFIATMVVLKFRPAGQAIVTGAFLVAYWVLLIAIPVPGAGLGVFTPDGNAAAYIDHLILGHFAFGENTWFLSYLGFAASVLVGVLAGELLGSNRTSRAKCLWLLAAGLGSSLLGLVWSVWLPIIKLMWTSSYVLVCGGLCCLMMAAFYFIIDVAGYKRWAFVFVVIGMNSIAVYMATMLFDFRKIGNIFVGSLLPRVGLWDGFLQASAALAIVWLILYWMYRTKSFLKL